MTAASMTTTGCGALSSAPFGIYVHIPYCVKKCPYCDFNSYALREAPATGARGRAREMEETRYVDALRAELRRRLTSTEWENREVRTIFFGGGTPSLFEASSIATIIRTIGEHAPLTDECEITLEANPGTIQEELHRDKLMELKAGGINRVSMGAQSFSPEKLAFLGRIHRPDDVRNAVANLRAAGLDNFNLDLMFGIAGETAEAWQNDLEQAIALGPKHISAYSLTIEPGTEFSRLNFRGQQLRADDDRQAEMYEQMVNRLEASGYLRYEISNFATPGAECAHNLGYWNGRDYLGVGAGAHSFASAATADGPHGSRWSNIPGPELYIERALADGNAAQRTESLTRERACTEFFLLRLRTKAGASFADFEQRFGEPMELQFKPLIDEITKQGLFARTDEGISLSPAGFLLADHLVTLFD